MRDQCVQWKENDIERKSRKISIKNCYANTDPTGVVKICVFVRTMYMKILLGPFFRQDPNIIIICPDRLFFSLFFISLLHMVPGK